MKSWILDYFPTIVNYIIDIVPGKIAFFTTDLEKFTWQNNKKFKVPLVDVGTPFAKGLGSDTAIKTGQINSMELEATLYGVPLRVITAPAYEDDNPKQVAGTYGIAIARDYSHALLNNASIFEQAMGGISTAIQQNAISANNININEEVLNRQIKLIEQSVAQIIEALGYINKLNGDIKMLGLNAAIEAARAGETGRGFGVVASEIRKLSDFSQDRTRYISNLTQEIRQHIDMAVNLSTKTLNETQEQAAISEEISAQIQELIKLVEQINIIAKEL